jgi:2-iminobutanoate/2-iminopropanoate deaminase
MKEAAIRPFNLLTLALAISAPAFAQRPAVEHFAAPARGDTPRPFSESVRVGDILYLSGQIGTRQDGTVPDDFDAQAKQTMENVGSALRARGLGWSDVFQCLVMLDDMADWPAFNKIYVPYFPAGKLPARSAFGADGLALGAKVELECKAHMPAR